MGGLCARSRCSGLHAVGNEWTVTSRPILYWYDNGAYSARILMKYTLMGSERVFYPVREIEADTIEEAREIYEHAMAQGMKAEDSEDFRIEEVN